MSRKANCLGKGLELVNQKGYRHRQGHRNTTGPTSLRCSNRQSLPWGWGRSRPLCRQPDNSGGRSPNSTRSRSSPETHCHPARRKVSRTCFVEDAPSLVAKVPKSFSHLPLGSKHPSSLAQHTLGASRRSSRLCHSMQG